MVLNAQVEIDFGEDPWLGDGVIYPDGNFRANFFQTDAATVDEFLGLRVFSEHNPNGLGLHLAKVAMLSIEPRAALL